MLFTHGTSGLHASILLLAEDSAAADSASDPAGTPGAAIEAVPPVPITALNGLRATTVPMSQSGWPTGLQQNHSSKNAKPMAC